MGRYELQSKERKKEFQTNFLPKELKWEEYSGAIEIIIEKIDIDLGTYPIFTSYFMQVGLKIPFDPLLVDFLRRTRLQIGQLAPDTVRTILVVVEINRWFVMQLDLWDIKYCYNFGIFKSKGRWNLKGWVAAPALVLGLWDSYKYMYSDIVIIKGDVELDPLEYPIPKIFGAHGS